MGFLTPWFLAAGAAALALPVYLHLLKQRKAKEVPFSSLMFFEPRTTTSTKQRRLKYYALLALRLAVLALLALAFAEPYLTRHISPLAAGQGLLVFVVDQSFSMREGQRFTQARGQALATLDAMPAGSRGQVLSAGSQVKTLTQPTDDKNELRAALQALTPTDGRADFGELARVLRNVRQSARQPLDVHLYSDLQKSALPPNFGDLRLPDQTRLELHPVSAKPTPNWYVENVVAPASIYSGRKIRVQATLAGAGTPAATRSVSLVLNGRSLDSKSVKVAANGRATVEFPAVDIPFGPNRGEVRLDSADSLTADDRFLFSVERGEPRRILFVHGSRSQRDVLYYQAALDASSEAAFTADPMTPEQAANRALESYALVVLSDTGALPPSLSENLRRYVAGGGAALIAAGPNTSAAGAVPLLANAVRGSRYAARGAERFQTVTNSDPSHPALRQANRWQGVRFYQTFRVDPGQARVIARMADDSPILLEQRVGEGRVLVFASGLDNLSNDFPLHASFVPFVEQTARYLAGLEDRQANAAVDTAVELRSAREGAASVEVTGPDGRRALSLREAATAQTFPLTQEGFYEVRRSNGRHELVAVHADRRESDLEPMPPDTQKLWQNTGQEPANTNDAGQPTTARTNLWWYALLLLLIAAIAESLYASRYLTREKETA